MQTLDVELQVDLVENALRDISENPIFRSSKQCRLLLHYIVEHSLAHHEDLLRERVIGTSVFGRAPDYDAGNDPVVRARVAEVRKRLAQYYLACGNEAPVLISIPSGSYVAAFSVNQRSPQACVPPERLESFEKSRSIPAQVETTMVEASDAGKESLEKINSRRNVLSPWILIGALLSVIVLFSGGLLLKHSREERSKYLFKQFWAPLLSNSKPAMIYIGANHTYRLTPTYLDGYRKQHHLENTSQEFSIDLNPTENISMKDLVPVNDLICLGDVAATGRIINTLASLGKKYDLRYGHDISITDLRSSPDILIGGFSNPWTMQLTHNLRYTLRLGDRIVDLNDKSKEWRVNNITDPGNDYVVVSRLVRSDAGDFVLIIGGVGGSSNQAAADFVSNPLKIDELLQNAPVGWEKMNMQVVLHTKTMGGIPTSADVQAVHFW
jgi:hypothetical protein